MSHQRPIIIRREAEHAAHHGGAWKVAYADFVTAMMALFIVLWLMSSSESVQKAIAGYFHDPSGTSKKAGTAKAGSGNNVLLGKENMGLLKDALQKSVEQVPGFEKLKDQVQMTVTGEGLCIELLETESGTFFPSGVSDLNNDGRDILTMLAKELGQLPNTVSIEGHTDSRPFSGRSNYGNWELSVDRANSARRVMQENGLGPKQVTQVRGFADQRLRKPEAPEDASNRRISLVVHYVEKPEPEDSAKPAAK